MEVILLERVKNLGDLGNKVKVKAGFGRNFLIPQKKAISANKKNLEIFEQRRAELEKAAAEKLKNAQERAEKLNALSLSMELQASEEGKLFGSVGTVEITHAIEEAGVEAEKREILMPEGPIHQIGDYEINIQVHSDVIATIKLSITAAA